MIKTLANRPIHARIANGKLETGTGSIENPDLIIEAGPAMRAIMARELEPADAIANGNIRVTGDESYLDTFARMFQIDPLPTTA